MFKRKDTSNNPKKLWEAYLKASLKQDWEAAKEALMSIIRLEPGNSRTHLKMGDLLQKMGKTRGAIKAYHRSADLLLKSGFGQKALALYKIILRLDPEDEDALSGSKRLLESTGAEGDALPAFSPDETPPLKRTEPPPQPVPEEVSAQEEPLPVVEGEAKPEEPQIDDISVAAAAMPTPTGWPEAGEGSPTQEEDAAEWPGQEGLQEGWPGEGPASPETGEDVMPAFDLGIEEAESEEPAAVNHEMPEEEESREPELPAFDVEGARDIGTEPIEWSGPLPEIFWSLTKEELAQIMQDSTVRTFGSGDVIVKEGDSGDSIYAIVEGSAEVTTTFWEKFVVLASLGAGDVFGEVAFLSGKPRTATVLSKGDTQVMDISRKVLERAIEKHPRILSCLAEYYHNRVRDTLKKVKRAKKPKSRFTIKD